MKKVGVLAAIALLLGGVIPASAGAMPTTEGGCQSEGSHIHVQDLGVGVPLVYCSLTVTCPKKRSKTCAVDVESTVSGTGMVGVDLYVGDEASHCSELSECSTSGSVRIAGQRSVAIHCDFGQGAATDVVLTCDWSLR